MNGLKIFLTTKVENQGIIAGIGDFFLTPARYLWNGKNVRVIFHSANETQDNIAYTEVHHVKSFHKEGSFHVSKTTPYMRSSSTHFLKTTLAIITLIPGLIFGSLFKGISFAYDKVRAGLSDTAPDYYGLLKTHFTPSERVIGSQDSPLDEDAIIKAINTMKRRTLHQKTDHFIVYGQGFELKKDPGFFGFGAKKIIFVGVKFAKEVSFEGQEYLKVLWNTTSKTVAEAKENVHPQKKKGERNVEAYLIPA